MNEEFVFILIILVVALLYALPTFIAFYRNHEYRWIIFAVNVVVDATGLGWLVAFVWAIYPENKSLADPILGNPTGLKDRNVGHTVGEVQAAADQTRDKQMGTASALEALDRLASLAERGVITPDEFEKKKADLLCHI